MQRIVTIPVNLILDIIIRIDDYRLTEPEKFQLGEGLFNLIKPLSDPEIENFSRWFLSADARNHGYGINDYEIVKEKLIKLKKKFTSEE